MVLIEPFAPGTSETTASVLFSTVKVPRLTAVSTVTVVEALATIFTLPAVGASTVLPSSVQVPALQVVSEPSSVSV